MSDRATGEFVSFNAGVLSAPERLSGSWLNEEAALAVSGLTRATLRARRQAGRLRSLPERRGPGGGGQDFWYFRDDIEALSRRQRARKSTTRTSVIDGGAHLVAELELALAKAEAREQELARVRAETRLEVVALAERLAASERQVEDLRGEVRRLRAMVRASVEVDSSR